MLEIILILLLCIVIGLAFIKLMDAKARYLNGVTLRRATEHRRYSSDKDE